MNFIVFRVQYFIYNVRNEIENNCLLLNIWFGEQVSVAYCVVIMINHNFILYSTLEMVYRVKHLLLSLLYSSKYHEIILFILSCGELLKMWISLVLFPNVRIQNIVIYRFLKMISTIALFHHIYAHRCAGYDDCLYISNLRFDALFQNAKTSFFVT